MFGKATIYIVVLPMVMLSNDVVNGIMKILVIFLLSVVCVDTSMKSTLS